MTLRIADVRLLVPCSIVSLQLRQGCNLQPTICKCAYSADAVCVVSGGTFQQMSGLPDRPGLPSPLGPQLWPLAFAPGNPSMLPAQPFQQLTTCSWEQNRYHSEGVCAAPGHSDRHAAPSVYGKQC